MAGTLIVALDLDSRADAERLVTALGDTVDFYKIGYQLAYGGDGLALGRALIAAKKRVFFDLKLLDIDNTVEHAVAAIARTGATFLTVHAYPKTMRAAAKAAAGSSLGILGVTVLTSMDDADVAEAGYARDAAWPRCAACRAGQGRRDRRARLFAARGRNGARPRRPADWRSSPPAFAPRAARPATRSASWALPTPSPPAPRTSSSAARSPKPPIRGRRRAKFSPRWRGTGLRDRATRAAPSVVIPGLDPGTQPNRPFALHARLGGRIAPGHDGTEAFGNDPVVFGPPDGYGCDP